MKTRCAVAAVLGLLVAASWSWAAPAFEKAVPEDTIAFVTVRSMPAFQQHLKADPLYAIWQEPSVQKFLQKPVESLRLNMTEAEGKAGIKFDEIWSLFHGQVALAVTTDPNDSDKPDVMLLVDVGNDGDRAMQLMALVEAASSKGPEAPKETAVEETYEGVKLIHMQPADDKGAQSGERHATYGVAGDVLILSDSDEAVKRTVNFLKAPPEKSLATTATYQAVLQKLLPEADVLGFMDIAQVTAMVKKHAADSNGGQGPQASQTLDATGLSGLGGLGLSLAIGPEFDTVQLFAQTVGERKGILKILTPAAGELNSGAEAPADAVTFMSVRFDPAGIFDEIQKMLGVMSPQVLAYLNAYTDGMSKKLGQPFDLRNDVLSVFGPRLAAYSRYEQPAAPDAKQQAIFIIDIVNKAAFTGMWDKLNKILPEQFAAFQAREYLGQQMYVLAPPGQQPPPPEGQQTPAFVVTDREFIYSPNVEALQAHLRRMNADGPTLRDQPTFQEALKTIPADGRVMFGFEDRSRQVEYVLKAIKDGDFAAVAVALRSEPRVAEFLDQFDLTLLPDAADITKHLSPNVFCAVVQPEGLLLMSRSRTMPQKTEPEK
ncbi:MAG: DUF3352 domain-containing protein [Candidatus Brocadiia bacterium]|jgi:hypothetical protein